MMTPRDATGPIMLMSSASPSPSTMAAVHGNDASAASLAQAPPIWQREVYDGLASALGPAPVLGIARRFSTDLGTRFAENSDRASLRRDAHAMVSSAGMLGFSALSQAAKALEMACVAESDVEPALTRVLFVRDATRVSLGSLFPGEG